MLLCHVWWAASGLVVTVFVNGDNCALYRGGSIKKKSLTSTQVKMYSCIDLWLGMFLDYYQRVTSNLKATAGYRRWPPSCAVCWQSKVLGRKITQPVRWPLFCHRQANAVEQSAWTASATGHHLRTIQTIVENVTLCLISWAAAPCVWTLRALIRNLLTYLLTLLHSISDETVQIV